LVEIQTHGEEGPKIQGREGRTPRIQRRLWTRGADCAEEDSGWGEEEDCERGRTERREQEHEGEGGRLKREAEYEGEGGRLKREAVGGESLVCGEAEWEWGGGKLPT
jgi:hypothetical protein